MIRHEKGKMKKGDSVSIHNKNLQLLHTDKHKVSKVLSPPIVTELFEQKNEYRYNLRHSSQLIIPAVNLVYHRTESASFFGAKVGDILPDRLKKIESLGAFKSVIKYLKAREISM